MPTSHDFDRWNVQTCLEFLDFNPPSAQDTLGDEGHKIIGGEQFKKHVKGRPGGGECQLQPDFAAGLLSGAHKRGINTAIETAFNVPWSFVEKVLPHVDVVLHDHKLTDSDRQKKWTGVPNKRILENMKRAYETWPDKVFIARTPLIPGVNDDEEHIRAVLAFIRPYKNVIDYELLPYMPFGESKYGFLGRVYEMQDFNPPTPETLRRLRAVIDEAFGRTASKG